MKTIKVKHRTDTTIEPVIYTNVERVDRIVDDDMRFCFQLVLNDGTTATYPAEEWTAWQKSWTRIR